MLLTTNYKFMDKHEYISLYERYIAGECTTEEKQLLEQYRDEFEWMDGPWDTAMGDEQQIRNKIYSRLESNMAQVSASKTNGRWRWIAAAAVIIAAMAIGLLLLPDQRKATAPVAKNTNGNYKNDILPGGNKAVLTLANGATLVLNKTHNGTILKQGLAAVDKTKDGQLVYTAPVQTQNVSEAIAYNTVSTPRGGQYQVVLPDGTNVWLNAASSLRFPTAFTGNERDVELTGEGYFEVAKNKEKPFKVKVNNVTVEVLGTHFDIMAYDNEPAIKATLLEGSVKIKKDASHAILVPGDQAIAYRNNSEFKVQKADLEETMAWKNGYFIFHKENIQDIMKKVARWYDVDVVYQGNVKNKDFGGSVSRFSNLSELLRNLELTETIHFKIEGRRVTVME